MESASSRILLESGHNRMVRGRYGYVLYNKHDIVVGRMMEAYGEYFESEVAIFRQACRAGDVVLDVGANIGTHTLAMAALVGGGGRVFAFEAQRVVFQTLCANVALNSLDHVECVHAAVGAENGTIQLADLRTDVPQNFGGAALDQIPGQVRTPLITLDAHLAGLSRLRLMKIDVEGMELDVLRGAVDLIKRLRPVVYMENDRPGKNEALIDFIRSLGYRAYWHLPVDFNPDNFFANPKRLFAQGFIDGGGEYLQTIGFAINLLCVPADAGLTMSGFREVSDSKEHPMKREHNAAFVSGAATPG
jgi:FkbM family methyltransferase